MGDVGSAKYEPALLPPCPTITLLCYSNCQRSAHSIRLHHLSFTVIFHTFSLDDRGYSLIVSTVYMLSSSLLPHLFRKTIKTTRQKQENTVGTFINVSSTPGNAFLKLFSPNHLCCWHKNTHGVAQLFFKAKGMHFWYTRVVDYNANTIILHCSFRSSKSEK